MKHARFFVTGNHVAGDAIRLEGGDEHKIRRVLRKRSGDEIDIIDSTAQTFRAVLEVGERNVVARIREQIQAALPERIQVTLAQAIPKGGKLDYAIEKLTELGVARIIPFTSERTIADAKLPKIDRWRRIARAAAAQCGRTTVPDVSAPATFAALLPQLAQYGAALIAWELADRVPLREILPDLLQTATSALIVIGPEGGFSHDEVALARQHGAHLISLGSRILRTETAAIALLSVINYEAAERGAS